MSEGFHPAQIEALRKTTPAQRLALGIALIEEMRSGSEKHLPDIWGISRRDRHRSRGD